MVICKQCGALRPPSNIVGKICRKCCRINRAKAGKCLMCGFREPLLGKFNCDICYKAIRESTRNRTKVLKAEVIQHYGARCAYCGESEPIFLTVDHINNDGYMCRNKQGKRLVGRPLYKYIVTNGFPSNIQVLCFNCNCAKNIYGAEHILSVLNDKAM